MREEAKGSTRNVLDQTHGLGLDPSVTKACARYKSAAERPRLRRVSSHLVSHPASGSASASLLRFLLGVGVLLAVLWFLLGGGLGTFLGTGDHASSTTDSPQAYEEGGYGEDEYEEGDYEDEGLFDEDLAPPPGAISGTAEELQHGARVHQDRAKAYKKIE